MRRLVVPLSQAASVATFHPHAWLGDGRLMQVSIHGARLTQGSCVNAARNLHTDSRIWGCARARDLGLGHIEARKLLLEIFDLG
jgi:hypothetical protein